MGIMKSGVLEGKIVGDSRRGMLLTSAVFLLIAMLIALLFGGVLGTLDTSLSGFIVTAIFLAVVVAMRQHELAATVVIVVHLYVDWYLGLLVVAQGVALVLLLIFFLARSPQYPWTSPPILWLWALFLGLAIFPAIRGAITRYDAAFYYPNIILGALIMFWLGAVIARNVASIRRFFKILAAVGAFLAVLTIIQATTGTLLFGSSRFDEFLASTANFALVTGSSVSRIGLFFVNPDWNGTFFATILFVPLGLFVESSSMLGKTLYLAEALLILLALLFTYSSGAWIAVLVGFAAFVLLVGRTRYRVLLLLLPAVIAVVGILFFPTQVDLQLQHTARPVELSLRVGAWQTGINVIKAFPLTGIGLGLQAYFQRAEPYRVPAQYLSLAHPHNSYIELGAMGGLPVLTVFLVLFLFALWQALRNRVLFDRNTRSLFAGGIAAIVALSANSLSINGWTLPPLAAIGWIILGALSSPLLAKSQVVK